MFFKGAVKKRAKKLFDDSYDMIVRMITEPELKMKHPDSSSIIFSAYLFMIAGFLGKGELSEEMVPIYQRFLIEQGASKNQFDYMTSMVQKYYSEIRAQMIDAQDEIGSNVDALLFALSDIVSRMTEAENVFLGTGIIKEYITLYLNRAGKIV